MGKIEVFFDGPWNKCIEKFKALIVILSIVWAAVVIYFGIQI